MQGQDPRAHSDIKLLHRDSTWLGSRAVGFSGLVFGLIVIDNAESGASHRSIFGFFNVPAQLYPWALLLLWQLLLPGVSFLGHLGGVLAGEVLSRGMLQRCLPGQSQLQVMHCLTCCASALSGVHPCLVLQIKGTCSVPGHCCI